MLYDVTKKSSYEYPLGNNLTLVLFRFLSANTEQTPESNVFRAEQRDAPKWFAY